MIIINYYHNDFRYNYDRVVAIYMPCTHVEEKVIVRSAKVGMIIRVVEYNDSHLLCSQSVERQ